MPPGEPSEGSITNHETQTAIVRPGRDDPDILAIVNLVPPSETFFFLKQRGHGPDVSSYYHIVMDGKRAYVELIVENKRTSDAYRLFYWTRSTAPTWLKRYL